MWEKNTPMRPALAAGLQVFRVKQSAVDQKAKDQLPAISIKQALNPTETLFSYNCCRRLIQCADICFFLRTHRMYESACVDPVIVFYSQGLISSDHPKANIHRSKINCSIKAKAAEVSFAWMHAALSQMVELEPVKMSLPMFTTITHHLNSL